VPEHLGGRREVGLFGKPQLKELLLRRLQLGDALAELRVLPLNLVELIRALVGERFEHFVGEEDRPAALPPADHALPA
jgi:hypothetical protein